MLEQMVEWMHGWDNETLVEEFAEINYKRVEEVIAETGLAYVQVKKYKEAVKKELLERLAK